MESSELRDLLEFLAKSNFVEFELERQGFRLRLLKAGPAGTAAPQNGGAPVAVELAPPVHEPAPGAGEAETAAGRFITVTSPIVGTFYRAPAPEAAAFVEIGSRIKKGQVLCIVEAMKLMNEIESEVEGEVLEVMVANGQPVEFGEVLFKIRPLG